MAQRSIYEDIARRTGGDIYIGVVGPVRCGKSTFITRFMQEMVLPNMTSDAARDRARDEMPQSAAGRTVMTTEPKFVPDEAVELTVEGGVKLRVKLVDCVGYMVEGAMGGEENGSVRMVNTPWSGEPMPFTEAAEYGTKRVMCEHATVGVLVTTDGSIGELPREAYAAAEARLVSEMKAQGKPFAVVLNCADPHAESAKRLAAELEESYGVPVAVVDCRTLGKEDISGILSMLLWEFPVTRVRFSLPPFAAALECDHPIRVAIEEEICRLADGVTHMGDVERVFAALAQNENVERIGAVVLDMGSGCARVAIELAPNLYFDVLSDLSGQEIRDEGALFALVRELAEVRGKYAKVREALESAEESGYGIVMPSVEDLRLEKPAIIKQQGSYGVRLGAAAQSIHMIRADICTELSPMIGSEQQSEEFLHNILSEFESDPKRLWESKLFGKSLYELVGEGLRQKLAHIPPAARQKLSETLERIVNEGANGLICVLL